MVANDFGFYLGGDDKGQAIAAATYLKNYIRKNIDASKISKEFRDAFMRALFQVEPAVLKVLVEGVCIIMKYEYNWMRLCVFYVCYPCLDAVPGDCWC